MNKLLAFCLVIAFAPAVADEAPPLLDLSPWKGRVVLVDFWASWCAPCVESFPWMGRMLELYGDRGLTIVAVNLDQDAGAARTFLERAPGGLHHISDPDGAIPEAFGVTVMPTSVLFDREGRPAYRHEGFQREDREEYERHIVALLQQRDDVDRQTVELGPVTQRGLGVRPWQRDILADAAMRLDCDPLDLAIDDHIYFSKEASSGGRGFGGGGCGCN